MHKKTPFTSILFKFYLFYSIFTNFVTYKKPSDIRYKSTYCVATENGLHVLLLSISSNTICRRIYRISEGFFFVCNNLCENKVKYVTHFLCISHLCEFIEQTIWWILYFWCASYLNWGQLTWQVLIEHWFSNFVWMAIKCID